MDGLTETGASGDARPLPPPVTHMIFDGPDATPDRIRYNPHRDIAYLHESLLRKVAVIMESRSWPDFKSLCEKFELGEDELAESLRVVCEYLNKSADYEGCHTPVEAMTAAGWFGLTPSQRLAFTSLLGASLLPVIFSARREIDTGEATPALTATSMLVMAERTVRLMAMSSARRWCVLSLERLRRSIARRWGG